MATALVVVAPGAQTTEQELLAWCREHLAAHQVPAVVTFTDHLPRNSVGKLIRPRLQKAAVELLLTQRRQPLLPARTATGSSA
jgi:acyl-coenzyme A synthetase/AMP-(fatty) acid ligase